MPRDTWPLRAIESTFHELIEEWFQCRNDPVEAHAYQDDAANDGYTMCEYERAYRMIIRRRMACCARASKKQHQYINI